MSANVALGILKGFAESRGNIVRRFKSSGWETFAIFSNASKKKSYILKSYVLNPLQASNVSFKITRYAFLFFLEYNNSETYIHHYRHDLHILKELQFREISSEKKHYNLYIYFLLPISCFVQDVSCLSWKVKFRRRFEIYSFENRKIYLFYLFREWF